VALGRLELIGIALADGRLVRLTLPRPGPVTTNAYWLLQSSSSPRPEVAEVVDWIKEEAVKVTF
jgi:LysR family transcriptional regulator, glycine cleavage system transcriptional activator